MDTNKRLEQNHQERILNVLVYIQQHLDEELSLETLSLIANFSPFHFHRFFSAYTGESLQSYVRRLRLERAARQLAFTNLSIADIAEQSRFQTVQSFHHAFKKIYQDTPLLFREKQLVKTTAYLSSRDAPPNRIKSKIEKDPSVTIKKMPAVNVVFTRIIGVNNETDLLQVWFQLITAVSMPIFLSDKTTRISILHDCKESTPLTKYRYDACITMDELPHDFKPKGNVGIQHIPSGMYAILQHHGSLKEIELSFRSLYRWWLPQHGYEPLESLSFAIHQNMPFQTPENELLTDIYLPIRKIIHSNRQ